MGKSFSKDECERKYISESNNCSYNIDDFIKKGICYGQARNNKQECLGNVKENTNIVIGIGVTISIIAILLIVAYIKGWFTKTKHLFTKKS
jgi:hypothetical protein